MKVWEETQLCCNAESAFSQVRCQWLFRSEYLAPKALVWDCCTCTKRSDAVLRQGRSARPGRRRPATPVGRRPGQPDLTWVNAGAGPAGHGPPVPSEPP
jgi:hypothetical protein